MCPYIISFGGWYGNGYGENLSMRTISKSFIATPKPHCNVYKTQLCSTLFPFGSENAAIVSCRNSKHPETFAQDTWRIGSTWRIPKRLWVLFSCSFLIAKEDDSEEFVVGMFCVAAKMVCFVSSGTCIYTRYTYMYTIYVYIYIRCTCLPCLHIAFNTA